MMDSEKLLDTPDHELATLAIAKTKEWSKPEPLISKKSKGREYPLHALSPTINEAVEEFIQYTPVPKALAGSAALAVAALSCQHHANIQIDAQKNYPLSLYFLIEQKSGERKSTVSRAFLKPVIEWEENQRHEPMEEEIRLSNSPRILYEDSTKESLILDLAQGHRSAALWSDEAGLIFGGSLARDSSPLGYLSLLSKAFHADKIVHRRKQAESAELYGYRLSCCLMMQPKVLCHLINLGMDKHGGYASETGFLSRFLFASPKSIIGSRKYIEAPEDTPAMRYYSERVKELLEQIPPENWGEIRKIKLSKEAKKIWIGEFERTESLCKSGEEFKGFESIASKHAEHVARIAGVLNAFECSRREVDGETMLSAILLGQWHLNEAIRVTRSEVKNSQLEDAEKLLEWLTKQEDKIILRSKVNQYGPYGTRDKSRGDAALGYLQQLCWLKVEFRDTGKIIHMNPLI